MANSKPKVTMTDIARASGFSLSTVSLVLNHRPGLPEETRARVFEAARRLGYRVRAPGAYPPARPERLKKVALFVARPAPGGAGVDSLPAQAAAGLLEGIETACRQENLLLIYAACPGEDRPDAAEVARLVEEESLGGVLLAGGRLSGELRRALGRLSLPVVLVETGQVETGFDALFIDHYAGAFAATRHLIQHGHRHIACLGVPLAREPGLSEDRQGACHGYRQALAVSGIAESYSAICPPGDPQAAAAASARLLRENPQVTAIFASRPGLAIPSLLGLLADGRRVPDDVSIIGVDGPELAESPVPALTTVAPDWADLGRLAVRTLLNRAGNPAQGRVTAYLQPRLIERCSVRPATPDQANLPSLPEQESA